MTRAALLFLVLMPYPESLHPYLPNTDDTQTYTEPGSPSTIWVKFDGQTKVEDVWDRVRVLTGADVEVVNETDDHLANHYVEVTGDTAKIRLTSDELVQDWGYKVSGVEAAQPWPIDVDPDKSGMLVSLPWPSQRGPWVYDGDAYIIVRDYNLSAVNAYMAVYKSSDYGRAWTIVDSAGSKLVWSETAIAAFRSGDVLYLLYSPNTATAPLRITSFDLATGLWGGDIATAGPEMDPAGAGNNRYNPSLVRRSDGSFVIFLTDKASANYNAQYCTWSSVSGWSALANATSVSPNQNQAASCVLGGSDRVHMTIMDLAGGSGFGNLVISTVAADGTLTTTDTDIAVASYYGYPATNAPTPYALGAETWFAIPIIAQDDTSLRFIRCKSEGTVSSYYSDSLSTYADGVFPAPGLLRDSTGRLYAVYGEIHEHVSMWENWLYAARYTGSGNEAYDNSDGWTDKTLLRDLQTDDQEIFDFGLAEVNGKIGVLYTRDYYYPWYGLWDKPGAIAACRYYGF